LDSGWNNDCRIFCGIKGVFAKNFRRINVTIKTI
jgi:hypothetical protein